MGKLLNSANSEVDLGKVGLKIKSRTLKKQPRENVPEGDQLLDFIYKDYKAYIINTSKELKKLHLINKGPRSLFTGPENLRRGINKSFKQKSETNILSFTDHKVPNQFSRCGIEALIDKT